jgi:hypothetical protein
MKDAKGKIGKKFERNKVVVKPGVAKDQKGLSKAAAKRHEKGEPMKKKVAETKKYGAS